MAIHTGTSIIPTTSLLSIHESCESTFFVQFFNPSKESFLLPTIPFKVEVTSFSKELVFWSLSVEE